MLADEEGHRIMGACPPEQATTLQLIPSFVRYARAHPTELLGNAAVAVFRALREAYPCMRNTTESGESEIKKGKERNNLFADLSFSFSKSGPGVAPRGRRSKGGGCSRSRFSIWDPNSGTGSLVCWV